MESKLCCDCVNFFYYWQLDNKMSKNSLAEGDSVRACARACGWATDMLEDDRSTVELELGRPSLGAHLLLMAPSFTTYDRMQTDAQSYRPSHLLLHQGLNSTSLVCSLWCNQRGASCVYFYSVF